MNRTKVALITAIIGAVAVIASALITMNRPGANVLNNNIITTNTNYSNYTDSSIRNSGNSYNNNTTNVNIMAGDRQSQGSGISSGNAVQDSGTEYAPDAIKTSTKDLFPTKTQTGDKFQTSTANHDYTVEEIRNSSAISAPDKVQELAKARGFLEYSDRSYYGPAIAFIPRYEALPKIIKFNSYDSAKSYYDSKAGAPISDPSLTKTSITLNSANTECFGTSGVSQLTAEVKINEAYCHKENYYFEVEYSWLSNLSEQDKHDFIEASPVEINLVSSFPQMIADNISNSR